MKRLISLVLDQIPYVGGLRRQVRRQGAYAAGHFYSPIPDRAEVLAHLQAQESRRCELPDIDLNSEGQRQLLDDYARYYPDLPFPEQQNAQQRYYYENDYFSYSDAIFLYSFLRKHRPRKIIEVGSGFSSAVMLDTVDRFLPQRPEMTFIDPYPERLNRLLRSGDKAHVTVLDRKVQDAPVGLFASLQAGDLLFIDSSHVVKCGGDLQLLLFDVLPHLPAGVFVHFHDVFYPFNYPAAWLQQGRYWNENYFLRAFLSSNSRWNIYFFNNYVAAAFTDFIKDKLPLCARNPGGSLYLQRL